MSNLRNSKYLLQNLVIILKIAQITTNYTFFQKPLTNQFQLCKYISKNFKTFMCIQEKLKMCKFRYIYIKNYTKHNVSHLTTILSTFKQFYK